MKRVALVARLLLFYLLATYKNVATAATLTNIYVFNATSVGAGPNGVVQGVDGNLYGTTGQGTNGGDIGIVFKISPSGSNFATVYTLPTSEWSGPYRGATLVQASDGNFYDTTYGYCCSAATVFRVSP